jgi:hypothetical protein
VWPWESGGTLVGVGVGLTIRVGVSGSGWGAVWYLSWSGLVSKHIRVKTHWSFLQDSLQKMDQK